MKLLTFNWFWLTDMATSYGSTSYIEFRYSLVLVFKHVPPHSPTAGKNTTLLHVIVLQSGRYVHRDQRKHLCTKFFLTMSTEPRFYGFLRLNDLFATCNFLWTVTLVVRYSAHVEQVKGPKEVKSVITYFSIVLTHTRWHNAKGKRREESGVETDLNVPVPSTLGTLPAHLDWAVRSPRCSGPMQANKRTWYTEAKKHA